MVTAVYVIFFFLKQTMTSVSEDVETLESLHIAGGIDCKMAVAL